MAIISLGPASRFLTQPSLSNPLSDSDAYSKGDTAGLKRPSLEKGSQPLASLRVARTRVIAKDAKVTLPHPFLPEDSINAGIPANKGAGTLTFALLRFYLPSEGSNPIIPIAV